jgi:molecular chaperone DnaK
MSNKPVTVYGIDLGTTFSCIASVDEYGKPTVIKNFEGDSITPSVVQFDGESRVVGIDAKNVAHMNPDSTVEMVKRQMGKAGWRFAYQGVDYTAEEISSYILRKVVNDAEASVGEKITDVVITCPAYFGDNERKATQKAGEITGLNVRSIINEPTAAAIAYGAQQEQDMVVLVYDLGGGTFDITMIAIKDGAIEVIATGGNSELGGRNWDEVIVSYFAEQWKGVTGLTGQPMDDPETLQDLFARAEQAKKSLSGKNKDKTEVAILHSGERAKITLTRDKFDELTTNLLEETVSHTQRTLEQAKEKGYPRFDRLLLVGGSTRMPQVMERLRVAFGVEPQIVDPDEVVAKGAALYGQKLAIGEDIKIKLAGWGVESAEAAPVDLLKRAEEEIANERGLSLVGVQRINSLRVKNVTSRSFGVEARERATGKMIVSNLIRVNQTVPLEVKERFGTDEANQESIVVRVMENTDPAAKAELDDRDEIGNAAMDLPKGLPQGSPIDITFRLDEQGRLDVWAVEPTTNKKIDATIQTSRVISEEEEEQAKQRAKTIAI